MTKYFVLLFCFMSSFSYADKRAGYALDDFFSAAKSANTPVFELFINEHAVIYLDNRKVKLSKAQLMDISSKYFKEKKGWNYQVDKRELKKTSLTDIQIFKQYFHSEGKPALVVSGLIVDMNGMWSITELDISVSELTLFNLNTG